MQSDRLKQSGHGRVLANRALEDYDTILVIGEVSRWQAAGRDLPQSSETHCIEFHQLSEELFEIKQPKMVISPVLCASFDCLDVAVLLQSIGFPGRYRAFSGEMPNSALIRSEISAACPDVDFDIINLAGTGNIRMS